MAPIRTSQQHVFLSECCFRERSQVIEVASNLLTPEIAERADGGLPMTANQR